MREALWRGDVGYVRNMPLHATKADVAWSTRDWTQRCIGTPPRAQSIFILDYP